MSLTIAISSLIIVPPPVLTSESSKTCKSFLPLIRDQSTSLLISILPDINPKATDAQVLNAGHWCVAGFAIFMAAFGTMLHGVNIDLGFIYVSFLKQSLLMGIEH